jgi:hypothetical protein
MAIYFFKATALVESMSLAIHFKASDELNNPLSIIIASRASLTDAQAQPLLLFIKADSAGACFRMPCGEKIVLIAVDKAAVSRAHQLFGGSRNPFATQILPTAGFIRLRQTTGAVRL